MDSCAKVVWSHWTVPASRMGVVQISRLLAHRQPLLIALTQSSMTEGVAVRLQKQSQSCLSANVLIIASHVRFLTFVHYNSPVLSLM